MRMRSSPFQASAHSESLAIHLSAPPTSRAGRVSAIQIKIRKHIFMHCHAEILQLCACTRTHTSIVPLEDKETDSNRSDCRRKSSTDTPPSFSPSALVVMRSTTHIASKVRLTSSSLRSALHIIAHISPLPHRKLYILKYSR